MANKKISELPSKPVPAATDILPIVDTQDPNNLATKQITISALMSLIGGGAINIDGGAPDSVYGSAQRLDGGGV